MSRLRFFPLETSDINLREGVTAADYDAVAAKYAGIIDKHGVKDHVAFTTEPYYLHENMAWSMTWWSYWPAGKAMGEYSAIWTGSWETPEGAEVIGFYADNLIYGNHKNWSTAAVKESSSDDNLSSASMIVIQNCRIKNAASMDRVLEAVQAMAADWSAKGVDNTVWIQFPAFTTRNDAIDFRLVSTFASFEAPGEAWDLCSPGTEAWAAGQEIAGDVFASYVDTANFVNVRRKSQTTNVASSMLTR